MNWSKVFQNELGLIEALDSSLLLSEILTCRRRQQIAIGLGTYVINKLLSMMDVIVNEMMLVKITSCTGVTNM